MAQRASMDGLGKKQSTFGGGYGAKPPQAAAAAAAAPPPSAAAKLVGFGFGGGGGGGGFAGCSAAGQTRRRRCGRCCASAARPAPTRPPPPAPTTSCTSFASTRAAASSGGCPCSSTSPRRCARRSSCSGSARAPTRWSRTRTPRPSKEAAAAARAADEAAGLTPRSGLSASVHSLASHVRGRQAATAAAATSAEKQFAGAFAAARDSLRLLGRHSHTAAVAGGVALVFGGVHRGKPSDLVSVRYRDLAVSQLPATGTPPAPRHGHAAAISSGSMLISSGTDGARIFGDVHLLSLPSLAWSTLRLPAVPRILPPPPAAAASSPATTPTPALPASATPSTVTPTRSHRSTLGASSSTVVTRRPRQV